MSSAPPLAPAAFPVEYGLWHYVWKLLRLRLVLTLSEFRRARWIRKIITVILALAILAAAGLAFVVIGVVLTFLRSPKLAQILARQNVVSVTPFLEGLPVLVLAAAFMGILLTSFGILLQALYLAGDMDFLLSTPVPIRAVFVSKLLEAILPNFSLVALFGLPLLFGLGAAGNYTVVYYPLVVIVLALLALTAAGLSSVLVMGVVRLFPARRVAEVLGLLGAVLSITCSQFNNLVNVSHLTNEPSVDVQIPLAWIIPLNAPWSPLSWAGRGLVDLGEGRWLTGLLFLALTLGLTSAIFGLSLKTAERLYYTGWASLQISPRKKRPAPTMPAGTAKRGAAVTFIERLTPPAVRAILWKDFLVLRRDLRQMSQVVTPIIFGIIYGIMLMRSGGQAPAGRGEAPSWFLQSFTGVLAYGNVGIALFVGWSLVSRLALMGFSQEGQNYWMLKSAPVRSRHLLAAKFLVAYLPTLGLGWLFMLVISLLQGLNLSTLAFGLGVVALTLAGLAGINLALGVTGANLTWEDPRRMTAGATGCLGSLISLGYVVICLGLFFGPPVILTRFGLPEIAGQVIGLALGGAVSLTCAIIALRLVIGKVVRIGES